MEVNGPQDKNEVVPFSFDYIPTPLLALLELWEKAGQVSGLASRTFL